MKTLLALLLIIPSLSWGSEEKARELYVIAGAEFAKNGCSMIEFKLKIFEIVKLNKKVEEWGSNPPRYQVVEVVKKTEPAIKYLSRCISPLLKEVVPRYRQIVDDYPSTEIAFKIIKNEEYIPNDDAIIIENILTDVLKAVDKLKMKYGLD